MIANRGLVPLENLVVSSFSIIRHGLQMTPRVSAAPSRRGRLTLIAPPFFPACERRGVFSLCCGFAALSVQNAHDRLIAELNYDKIIAFST